MKNIIINGLNLLMMINMKNYNKVKLYIDTNNKRPTNCNKENKIRYLATFIQHQQKV